MEVVTLFLLSVVTGVFATFIFELVLQTNKKLRDRYYRRHEVLFGFHVHHSTIGLLLVIASIPLLISDRQSTALTVIGVGLGIIIMHTISSKRFVFIERENF